MKQQHFLLSARAKTLTLVTVLRMSDAEAEEVFRKVRWSSTDGKPVCSECGGLDAYEFRRASGALRFECRACRKEFSITSGTLFASHKLPLRTYLGAIAIFINEVKGKSALALSRDLGLSYKAAFVLLHKLREAMACEIRGRTVGGEGKTAEIDGGYFGGYIKPANLKDHRTDRRLRENKSGKRKCVVVIRERGGETLPAVFRSEKAALNFVRTRILPGTIVNADESKSWESLHARFEMRRINHQEAYSLDGACTNWAEEFFSRLRRAEIGHHHHIAGDYLLRYAQESAWREDNRRVSNGPGHAFDLAASRPHAERWVNESYEQARILAFGKLPSPGADGTYVLNDAYVANAKIVVSLQLQRAGVRLAAVLNKALQ